MISIFHALFVKAVPSKTTFARVFSSLSPDEFKQCFIAWIQSFQQALGNLIAIDGKTLRKNFDKASGQSPIHMVSAFAAASKLVLGQQKTSDKSNEITAIPKLLELLALEGMIVRIDAMGTQKEALLCSSICPRIYNDVVTRFSSLMKVVATPILNGIHQRHTYIIGG